jgi:acyl-CoA synthetase (AMP-forming)/AMP-acid ligase II
MHISHWAQATPDTIAVRMAGSGETLTFRELDQAADRGAQLLRSHGLARGDVFAIWSTNNPGFLEVAFAMQRSGLYMTPIASKLKAEEAVYIINDSGARVVILDAGVGAEAEALARQAPALCPGVERFYSLRGDLPGLARWEDAARAMPARPIADPSGGRTMIYSSGTTGKPKGVRQPLPTEAFDAMTGYLGFHRSLFKTEPGTYFVGTAPLYHAGPCAMVMADLQLGGSLLLFEKFDPEKVLAGVAAHQVRRGQFVPTMFTRMLKLPQAVRARYDLRSMQVAMHSAAPCPVEVKRGMIAWWGPVIYEIYGGTENVGSTLISSQEWLAKPGSVGRAMAGRLHVCAEDGSEVGPDETGLVYFESASTFTYLNDPAKTRDARHPEHPDWATFGDIGRVDEDGYLFLSDRRAFMIICGGVNIYPQEAENVLTLHPDVAEVAVFGVPDPDMGEQVKAVIQPADWSKAGPALEAELIAYCRERLASLKCPKSIDFEPELPRDPTGKMMKRQLRDRYWAAAGA